MICSRGCTWCQELIFIISAVFMIHLGVFVVVVFGSLVAYHGVMLPVAIVISCGVIGCITSVIVNYQRFTEAEQSRWLLVLSGTFYVCCGLGCYIFLAFYASRDIHLGKMGAYLTQEEDKEMIDKTQMLFECCGDTSYTDWFNVDWQGTDIEPLGDCGRKDIISRTAVPFSCCAPDAAAPCIHNYLQMDHDARLYREGCKPILVAVATLFSVIIGAIITTLGVLMLLWAFCSNDDYGDVDDDKASIYILKVPNKLDESPSSKTVNSSNPSEPVSVSLNVPDDDSDYPNAFVDGKYQSPLQRNADILNEHEQSLRTISPIQYMKNTKSSKDTLDSSNTNSTQPSGLESVYSEDDEESSQSSITSQGSTSA